MRIYRKKIQNYENQIKQFNRILRKFLINRYHHLILTTQSPNNPTYLNPKGATAPKAPKAASPASKSNLSTTYHHHQQETVEKEQRRQDKKRRRRTRRSRTSILLQMIAGRSPSCLSKKRYCSRMIVYNLRSKLISKCHLVGKVSCFLPI